MSLPDSRRVLPWLTGLLLCAALPPIASTQDDSPDWATAANNGARSQQATRFCRRHAEGWLARADPISGLLPRRVNADQYWNAQDCAADNYPFLVLTALMLGDHHLEQAVRHILTRERTLTPRLGSLPDDFVFATQSLRPREPSRASLMFGASEYVKDGLMPVVEWTGPGVWFDRMKELLDDVEAYADVETAVGVVPSRNVEVVGELLQALSRFYWWTGDEQYRRRVFRLADLYFLHEDLLDSDNLRLRDHGCEILGGLSEAYVLAVHTDLVRRERYRPILYALLDRILEVGVNEHGLMPNSINPRTGAVVDANLSDGWGYVYNAFLTVAEVDEVPRYREAVAHALRNIHKYPEHPWEGAGGADGYADSIEGAINLLNRIPVISAFDWVHQEIQHIFEKQRPDGITEGWYGDGNSARTALMYALMCTQGITATPWRDDLRLGAVAGEDGAVHVSVQSEWPWQGTLRFDRTRHREVQHLPLDYARINQFPEWFTVERTATYVVQHEGKEPRPVRGRDLGGHELSVGANQTVHLTVRPLADGEEVAWRKDQYTTRSPGEARAWQEGLRKELAVLLKVDDLAAQRVPLGATLISSTPHKGYALQELALQSTAGRRISVLLTLPDTQDRPAPAVVCLHGHGGNRRSVHDRNSIYHGFAAELAQRGTVTVSLDVGQHEVYEPGRTLMGERLWDAIRCVDLLESLEQVDSSRLGCAGLSLGGEMAMWLGAMDERVAATVSSGFLTTMDQMEQNHCLCWKFPGLRERVDYADLYALIAPRALLCQNGLNEGERDFYVPLARQAWEEVLVAFWDLGARDQASFVAFPGGHEIHLSSLLSHFGAW